MGGLDIYERRGNDVALGVVPNSAGYHGALRWVNRPSWQAGRRRRQAGVGINPPLTYNRMRA